MWDAKDTNPLEPAASWNNAAHALSDLVGLTVSGGVSYGDSADRSEVESWRYVVGVAVDFNLFSQGGPPLGFVVGAGTGSVVDVPGTAHRTTQNFFGRIGYTGSREFALGLDLAYELVPVRDTEDKQGFMSAVIDIRLFLLN